MAPSAKRETTLERRKELDEDAAAIVQREYAQELRLDQVALRVATSRRQLQRAFLDAGQTNRHQLGHSPSGWRRIDGHASA